MKYMFLICSDEAGYEKWTEEDLGKLLEKYGAFDDEARTSGVYVEGYRLQPTPTATTVRVRKGETLTTDGPFAETKEQLGGYYILDVPDLDAAISWAAKIPSSAYGSVEVRPIWEME
ncbi:MAG: YciI family protein [Planctomycetota bacterium]